MDEILNAFLIWMASSWPLFFILLPVAVGSYGFYKHASKHTDGTDDIQSATTAQKGLLTPDRQVLDIFEALSAEKWNQQFNNLLLNGSFESWSAGAAAVPDGWAIGGAGAAIAREATVIRFGEYSAKLTRGGNDCNIYQLPFATIDADTNTYWRGRTVTLGCWVYATVADRARIHIDYGTGTANSSYHTGGSTWEFLTLTVILAANATQIAVSLQVNTGDTSAYFDGAILIEGTIYPTFAQHPNDEHLKAIDYQDTAPANFDYGLLRMECGQIIGTFGGAANYIEVTVTFGTAFSKILVALAVQISHTGLTINQQMGAVKSHTLATNTFKPTYGTRDETNPDNGDTVTMAWIAIGVV